MNRFDQHLAKIEAAKQAIKDAEAALQSAKETLQKLESVRMADVCEPEERVQEWRVFWGIKSVTVFAHTEDNAKRLAAPQFRVRVWPQLTAVPVLPVSV